MFPVTYDAASIFLETHFLPGDTAELRLDCEGVTVTASAVTVHGIETRHIEKMWWTADYLSFEQDGQQHRIKVGRPAVKPPLRAYFPRT
ncbi:hypothetical protein AB4Z48_17560 [Cupriavidus sp. 2TAF22]|uniref:hypothetical protein n=1 Tax=unclassified Cupriavidus TaxID=2640874 RepID=UPI003F8ED940